MEKSPHDHPWSRNIMGLTFPAKEGKHPFNKSVALRVLLCRHLLHNDSIYRIAEALYIYPHNYPLALLSWRNDNPKVRLTTTLFKNNASMIAESDYGNNRLVEYTNSLAYMMIKSGGSTEQTKHKCSSSDKITFIQSPMATRNEIKVFINDLVRQKKS